MDTTDTKFVKKGDTFVSYFVLWTIKLTNISYTAQARLNSIFRSLEFKIGYKLTNNLYLQPNCTLPRPRHRRQLRILLTPPKLTTVSRTILQKMSNSQSSCTLIGVIWVTGFICMHNLKIILTIFINLIKITNKIAIEMFVFQSQTTRARSASTMLPWPGKSPTMKHQLHPSQAEVALEGVSTTNQGP